MIVWKESPSLRLLNVSKRFQVPEECLQRITQTNLMTVWKESWKGQTDEDFKKILGKLMNDWKKS